MLLLVRFYYTFLSSMLLSFCHHIILLPLVIPTNSVVNSIHLICNEKCFPVLYLANFFGVKSVNFEPVASITTTIILTRFFPFSENLSWFPFEMYLITLMLHNWYHLINYDKRFLIKVLSLKM